MHDKHNRDTQQNNSGIKPANIELTQVSVDSSSSARNKPNRRYFIWAGLGVLLVFTLGVIFVLPRWYVPPKITVTKQSTSQDASDKADTSTTVKPINKSAASPWNDAQQAKLRRETQETLSNMLESQEILENKAVKLWAEQPYLNALKLAEAGDAAYRQQEFAQAQLQYQQALNEFNQLLQNVEEVFDKTITEGNQALLNENSAAAKQAFQLALLLKPDDAAAIKGSNRAETLDEVIALTDQGDVQLKNDQLEEAKITFQQTLKLDSDTKYANDQLKLVEKKINDRDFTQAMSEGYAALEISQLDKARTAFLKASKIKPHATEAQSALRQTVNSLTSRKINALLSQAQDLEASEQWQQAADKYAAALALDSNLVSAQQGKQHTLWRASLDKRLQQTISRPERLSDKSVYNETMVLYREARNISEPGPKLDKQLNILSILLKQAIKPVLVQIHSDGITKVTLYKIGELGSFHTKELSLLPGRYVSVGTRSGYRDVRVEFTVEPNKPMSPIVIRCEEKIAFGI